MFSRDITTIDDKLLLAVELRGGTRLTNEDVSRDQAEYWSPTAQAPFHRLKAMHRPSMATNPPQKAINEHPMATNPQGFICLLLIDGRDMSSSVFPEAIPARAHNPSALGTPRPLHFHIPSRNFLDVSSKLLLTPDF
jgi:hypothetical protein